MLKIHHLSLQVTLQPCGFECHGSIYVQIFEKLNLHISEPTQFKPMLCRVNSILYLWPFVLQSVPWASNILASQNVCSALTASGLNLLTEGNSGAD